MSNPNTPTGTSSSKVDKKSKSSKRKTKHRRRGSGNSNASIISIDYASLKKLRKFQDKVEKENKKQRQLYDAQKQSKLESMSKQLEIKEDTEDDSGFHVAKSSSSHAHAHHQHQLAGSDQSQDTDKFSYDSSSSKEVDGMVDITVEELLPILKNMVDRYNNLQQEHDTLTHQLREQQLLLEDRMTPPTAAAVDKKYMSAGSAMEFAQRQKLIDEYEEKMELLETNFNTNLMSMEAGYKAQIDALDKSIKGLHKELRDGDKENEALRASVEALEHENESLRINMNQNNQQFQNVKILKNKNKQLVGENDELRQQLEQLEQEMDFVITQQQEQQQMALAQQQQMYGSNSELQRTSPHYRGVRPQTPNHRVQKTLMIGANNSNNNSAAGMDDRDRASNLSEHGSSAGGNDLLHQIGDYELNHDPLLSGHPSSVEPADRDSNYNGDQPLPPQQQETTPEMDEITQPPPPQQHERGSDGDDADDDEDDDDDGASTQLHNDDDRKLQSASGDIDVNILANLRKYKKLDLDDPNSMAQILQLLQAKETKRMQASSRQQSHNDALDAFSQESNYSDSDAKLEQQIDAIEDELRELKDMVSSLVDSTNNISPQINNSLGPLLRKVNRMYVMLTGPMGPVESRTSLQHSQGVGAQAAMLMRARTRSFQHDSDDDEAAHAHAMMNEAASNYSLRSKDNRGGGGGAEHGWMRSIMPYVTEWGPAVGFSAILLFSVYVVAHYRRTGKVDVLGMHSRKLDVLRKNRSLK